MLDHFRQDLSVLPLKGTIRPPLQLHRLSEARSVFLSQALLRSCRKREHHRRFPAVIKTARHPILLRLLVGNFRYFPVFRLLQCFLGLISCATHLLFTPVTLSGPRNLVE